MDVQPSAATTLASLRQEHERMGAVLQLVARQLDTLESGGGADFPLLGHALAYMHAFPSQVHHPKEDALFGRLALRDPACRSMVREIREQHLQIYEIEIWLKAMALHRPASGAGEAMRFISFGREFLRLQRDHARTEEMTLFPRALQVLDRDDWEQVAAAVSHSDDPLDDEHRREDFQILYDCLLREPPHP